LVSCQSKSNEIPSTETEVASTTESDTTDNLTSTDIETPGITETLYENTTNTIINGNESSLREKELLQYAELLSSLLQSKSAPLLSAVTGDYNQNTHLDFLAFTQPNAQTLLLSYYQLDENSPQSVSSLTFETNPEASFFEHHFNLITQSSTTTDANSHVNTSQTGQPFYKLHHTYTETVNNITTTTETYYILEDTSLQTTLSNLESTENTTTQVTPLLLIGTNQPNGIDYTNQGKIILTLSGYGVAPNSPLDLIGQGILEDFPYALETSLTALTAIEGIGTISLTHQLFYHSFENKNFGIYEDLYSDRIVGIKLFRDATFFGYQIGQNQEALMQALDTTYQKTSVAAHDNLAPTNASYAIIYANKQNQLIIYFDENGLSLEGYFLSLAAKSALVA
jgi:hypothetical protein